VHALALRGLDVEIIRDVTREGWRTSTNVAGGRRRGAGARRTTSSTSRHPLTVDVAYLAIDPRSAIACTGSIVILFASSDSKASAPPSSRSTSPRGNARAERQSSTWQPHPPPRSRAPARPSARYTSRRQARPAPRSDHFLSAFEATGNDRSASRANGRERQPPGPPLFCPPSPPCGRVARDVRKPTGARRLGSSALARFDLDSGA